MVLILGWSWNEVSLASPRSRPVWPKDSAQLRARLPVSLLVSYWHLAEWWTSSAGLMTGLDDLKGLSQTSPLFFQPSLIIFLRNLPISPSWVLGNLSKSLFDYCINHRKVLNNFWARFSSGGKGCGCQVGSSTTQHLLPQSGHLRVTAALGLWEMQHWAFWSAQVVLPSIQKQLESSILHIHHLLAF